MKLFMFLLLPYLLFAQAPKLLLLQTYSDQNVTGWLMSEKLDGVRAFWNGKELLTRKGKKIYAPAYFTKDYPPFAIDGELWSKRGDFEHIVSIVRDRNPSDGWKEIKHYIFEVPHAKGNLLQRLKKVKPYEGKYIKIISQTQMKEKKDLKEFLIYIESLGGEGVVLRDSSVGYIAKRTSKALKVKSFYDTECHVVGYTPGRGKYSGKVGALRCRLENGIEFKIGSGLSDIQRANPPKIGSLVTFKYQGFTKYAKPRFPIFMRVKEE